jgi:hypothetical protein
MSEDVERMVAEVLAQRLGLHGDDGSQAPSGNPIKAALALSLMQHFQSQSQDGGSVLIRRVAAIVGACPRCLGEDMACALCEGQGQPGFRAPHRDAFLEWIATPLQSLGLQVSARKSRAKPSPLIGRYSQ